MLRLAAVFGAHMVLQQGKPIAVFGEADGPVEVELAGIRAAADSREGRFLVRLPSMAAGGPHTLTVRCGQEAVTLADVMLGEVWLCGGQSNMEYRLRDEQGFSRANTLRDSRVRFYETPQAATSAQAEALERDCAWKLLAPDGCGEVSAVAFYAAQEMARRLNVAVGMIVCCLGGTSASCWMSRETLAGFPEGQAYLTDFEAHVTGKTDEQYEQENAAYQREVDRYNAASAALKAENPAITFAEITQRIGDYPWPPPWGRTMLRRPAGPYETMLTRVAPMTLRGFLYYQGEQDAAQPWAKGYAAVLAALIAQWRRLFMDDTLFFAAAQLPRFGADASAEDWPAIRAAQQAVTDAAAHAALACLLDCGERDNVHPADKQTPGHRLAALALAHVYGQNVPADAPRLTGAELSGGKLTLTFAGTGGGLRIRGEAQSAIGVEGAQPCGVEIAGSRCVLALRHAASSVRVRYGQENWPATILTGENGLPVFPFDMTVPNHASGTEECTASHGCGAP
ncbi:MAG: sialate O-acetylesterase [Aristaeellaceae bacterium]